MVELTSLLKAGIEAVWPMAEQVTDSDLEEALRELGDDSHFLEQTIQVTPGDVLRAKEFLRIASAVLEGRKP